MRLGGGRVGERRHTRAFVPLFEKGRSVWTVTCLQGVTGNLNLEGIERRWLIFALVINTLDNFYNSLMNKYLCEHNFKVIDK